MLLFTIILYNVDILSFDSWLVKTKSFLIGDFTFMTNTDWMTKKQLDANLINHLYKQ